MQICIYLLLLLCISTTYLFAQNTTIKPDKVCINCQTDTLELGTVLRVKGNTKLEGTINIISTLTSTSLQQNATNPFNETTTISYFIPEGTKSASLQFLDQNGRIIKNIPIQDTGNGQITLQANLLSAGTYSYSLVLDGRVMETKQMVLTH